MQAVARAVMVWLRTMRSVSGPWLLLLAFTVVGLRLHAGAAAAAESPAAVNSVPVLAVQNLDGVNSGLVDNLFTLSRNSSEQLTSGQNPALKIMSMFVPAATVFVPSDEALGAFASAVGSSYTSKNLLDAFTASPQQFWTLMASQIINGTTLVPKDFLAGKGYTALSGTQLVLSKQGGTGPWMINDVAAINTNYIMAGNTALYAVSRFTTAPDPAIWAPLLAAVSAAPSPAPAAAETTASPARVAPNIKTIGISLGISLGIALFVGIGSLLCVMYRRRLRAEGQDAWAVHNAPTAVIAAAAAAGNSPWTRRRRKFFGFRSRRGLVPRSAQHTNSAATISSRSTSSSFLSGISQWRNTGASIWSKSPDDVAIPITGSNSNGVGLRNGALCAVGTGAVIAPLPTPISEGDSSDEDAESSPRQHHAGGRHHKRHMGHMITARVLEGTEGLENGTADRQDSGDVEQGFGVEGFEQDTRAGGMNGYAAAAAAVGGSWPQNSDVTQQDDQYPRIFSGGLAGRPGSKTGKGAQSVVLPKITEVRLQTFLAQWQESGSPGGRVLALPMFGMGAAGGLEQQQLHGAAADSAADTTASSQQQHEQQQALGEAQPDGSSVEGDQQQQDQAVSPEVAALGPWAVDAVQDSRTVHHSLLLRQVVLDLATGRHPVTHNFCVEDHQSPWARHNTVVLFAHNKNNNKRATIKFYAPRSPGYAAETSAYYQMASRHIPFLESTFSSPDGSYASALVMECGERSLKDMLAEHKPTDLPRKIEIFHQLVLDVRHMHSHNLVHRDLQPKHLLFCSEGMQWKLIDFSTTVPANSMVVPEVFSIEFCAPEVAEAVARGDRAMVATPAADMWSIGVMAYELSTGQPFYPAHWTNEDIWRSLLGFTALPSETLDIVAQVAPGEKAFMKKIAHLLHRNPMQRMTAERLASSRLFSACAATTTNVPLHAVQQQQGDFGPEGGRELFRRLGSINRALEKIGFRVEASNALGLDILKQMTVNSLILSVNLQELRPRLETMQGSNHPLAERVPGQGDAALVQGYSQVLETQGGPVTASGLTMGQAGALGLVDKEPAPLVDDGAGKPLFLLRQNSSYLVEITVMHAKGQQLPDQTAIESLVLEAPDGSKQTLQLGPTCRSKSQLMVSAVWEPSSSRSKLVSNVTPKRLWGREGSVPLSLSICLTMCLVPESAAPEPASLAAPSTTNAVSRQTLLPYASSVSDYQSVYSQSDYGAVGSVAGSSNAGGMAAASGSRFGRLEPVWVNSELTMRMVPANTSFKYVRAFRYMEECWSALPPEARGVMQGLVLLVRGVAGGAAAFAGLIR